MSAEIVSLAEFRARRETAGALAAADALATAGIGRPALAEASRALAASIEQVRRHAVALNRARARARCLYDLTELMPVTSS
jgi:hypothetical protein